MIVELNVDSRKLLLRKGPLLLSAKLNGPDGKSLGIQRRFLPSLFHHVVLVLVERRRQIVNQKVRAVVLQTSQYESKNLVKSRPQR